MASDASGPPAAQVRPGRGGIGRTSSRAAERVSDDLRLGTDELLSSRRRMAALTLGAMGSLGVVALYQFGLIRHLPEPPVPLLSSDEVDASGEAYSAFTTPDAPLGIASYAVTLALIGAGARDRARERPFLVLAMAAKVASDTAGAVLLTAEQATKHRKFCTWCLATAVLTAMVVPHAIPETRQALRTLRG
jgi:uncharacterized membrane protein